MASNQNLGKIQRTKRDLPLRKGPDEAQKSTEQSYSFLVPFIICILISLIALVVRREIAYAMFVSNHPDEPIMGTLAMSALQNGAVSANWEGHGTWWSRSTYQFSPYTLMQQSVSLVAARLKIAKSTFIEQIFFARLVNTVLASITVAMTFITIRNITDTLFAPILGSLLLAFGFLHVQDSCYARVEAFLSLAVISTAYCALRAAGPIPCRKWALASAAFAGIAIATKYNSLPVLAMVALAAFYSSPKTYVRHYSFVGSFVVFGFLLATPELLVRPSPFLEGITFEAKHYAEGNIPYLAFDFWDNNVFYMAKYMGGLGLGYLPCCLVLLIFPIAIIQRNSQHQILAVFLLVAVFVAVLPRARFERNYEVFYCVAVVAAAVSANELIKWARINSPSMAPKLFMPILLIATISQPAIAVYRFRHALVSPPHLFADYIQSLYPNNSKFYLMWQPIPDDSENPAVVIVGNLSDAFSRHNLAQWEKRYTNYKKGVYMNDWKSYGYPFSTVDDCHGPSELVVFYSPHLSNSKQIQLP